MNMIEETKSTAGAIGAELLAELETVHAERKAREGSEVAGEIDERLYDRHWALREKIDGMRARTLAELAVKARAAQIELERDGALECDGPGSYVGLTQSLLADILAMDESRLVSEKISLIYLP